MINEKRNGLGWGGVLYGGPRRIRVRKPSNLFYICDEYTGSRIARRIGII